MIEVTDDTHYAAARLKVLTGGRFVRSKTQGRGGMGSGDLLEYVLPGGEVVARKVSALGQTLCWLRADLAGQANAAMAAEAADYARATAEVAEFIRSTDRQGAERTGSTVEQYRARRHAAGNRWDRYRAQQRAGGF
jgi:hypothetical protein